MNPAGGKGAITAIHDAVTLANWMSTLRSPSPKDITKVFKEYRTERYPIAKENFESSQVFTKNLGKVWNEEQCLWIIGCPPSIY